MLMLLLKENSACHYGSSVLGAFATLFCFSFCICCILGFMFLVSLPTTLFSHMYPISADLQPCARHVLLYSSCLALHPLLYAELRGLGTSCLINLLLAHESAASTCVRAQIFMLCTGLPLCIDQRSMCMHFMKENSVCHYGSSVLGVFAALFASLSVLLHLGIHVY